MFKFKHGTKIITSLMVVSCLTGFNPITTPKAHAAIPVIDVKNIAETAKVYLQTTKLLDESQKQVAMMLLNIKSWKAQDVLGMWKIVDEKHYNELGEKMGKFFSRDKNITAFMNKYFPDTLGAITSGKIKDPYQLGMLARQGVNDVSNGALMRAKFSEKANEYITKMTKKAVDKSIESTGILQAQQAQTMAQASTTEAIKENTSQVAAGNAVIATEAIKKAQQEEAAIIKNKMEKAAFSSDVKKRGKVKIKDGYSKKN